MQEAYIVLGMHHGGSPALAAALGQIGLATGALEQSDTDDSKSGNTRILAIHDRFLAELDLAWDDFRRLPPFWSESSRLADLSSELEETIHNEFGSEQRWVVEDPRLWRLLPIWLPVLRRLKVSPRFLLVHRPVEEVSAAMKAAHGFSVEKSAALWSEYFLSAEFSTRDHRRALLSYEQLLQDPVETLRQCWQTMDLEWRIPAKSEADSIAHAVNSSQAQAPAASFDRNTKPDVYLSLARDLETLVARCRTSAGTEHASAFDRFRWRLHDPGTEQLALRVDDQDRVISDRTAWLQNQVNDFNKLRDDVIQLMQQVWRLQKGGPVRRIGKFGIRAIRSPQSVMHEISQWRSAHRRRAITHDSAITPERIAAIGFAAVDKPVASIVIPVFNHAAVTVACLESIAQCNANVRFEVIVVDDASTEADVQRLADIEGLKLLRNEQNQGFIRTCNRGAAEARGEFLVFLNNDTLVSEGWLDALLRTFEDFPDAGLVGGKLVLPDGTLQEAGGIVWRDGSAWNFGRGKDPDEPAFNYARQVDYCSGACLAIRRKLFTDLDGFDELYVPAYYEDTDLAFRVRQADQKVYYQPLCTVYHDEGTTSGTSTEHGVKKYQVENGRKFFDRWRETLLTHRANGELPELEKERHITTRTLFIDHRMVAPDQDSGSVRTFNMLRILQGLGHKVTFIPDNLAAQSPYTEQLQAVGIEVLYHPYISSIEAHLKKHGKDYDYVFLSRLHVATKHIETVRQLCVNARIAFDTVDLHFLREMRAAEVDGSTTLVEAELTRGRELRVASLADSTVVVSPYEVEVLAEVAPELDVHIVSNIHETHPCEVPFDERQDMLFIGGFEHPPNVDAMLWFTSEILPLIHRRLPDVRLHIVGSKAPNTILQLNSEKTPVHGFVPDADPFFRESRLSIAPLRYGAGVKGKVNHSLAWGLPCVATTMAAEGMALQHGVDILIADEAEAFADAVIRLYTEPDLWKQLSAAGYDNIEKYFSFNAARRSLTQLCPALEPTEKRSMRG